ncbi:MAG: endonuclease/exonuclease/phosphatase family protein [Novosphingobium sp.]
MIAVATWNTEWREPGSRDGRVIRDRLQQHSPDIVCLTEAHVGLLDEWGGFVAEGSTEWGGPVHGTRRKVLLWSRNPWTAVDVIGSPDLPPGMFAKAETETVLGPATVIGIVIPFHMANVRSGRRDRKMWEDHQRYLEALPAIIAAQPERTIVLGDYNQRIPSTWVPRRYQQMLAEAFAPMNIATTELRGPDGKLLIDHIANGPSFIAGDAQVISNIDEDGREISDHVGVVVQFGAAA